MARPIPRVPPVTIAFLPFNPRSIGSAIPCVRATRRPAKIGSRDPRKTDPGRAAACRLRRPAADQQHRTGTPGTRPETCASIEYCLPPCGSACAAVPARVRSRRSRRRRRAAGLLANPDFRRLWVVGLVVVRGALAGDDRRRRLRLPAHRIGLRRGADDAVAHAADGAVRGDDRRARRAAGAAQRADRRRPVDAGRPRSVSPCSPMPDSLAVWHLAVASFCNGIAWAADNPVRRVMIGEVVGHERMGAAMSVDVGANNASRMLGPTIGGLLLAGVGISGAFTVSVALLCARAGRRAARAPPQQPGARRRRRHRARAHGRGPAAGAARQEADRHPDDHGHLQCVRLAVHRDDPGDRAGQSAPRRERHRHARQHGRHRRVLRRDRNRPLCPAGRITRGSTSAGSSPIW